MCLRFILNFETDTIIEPGSVSSIAVRFLLAERKHFVCVSLITALIEFSSKGADDIVVTLMVISKVVFLIQTVYQIFLVSQASSVMIPMRVVRSLFRLFIAFILLWLVFDELPILIRILFECLSHTNIIVSHFYIPSSDFLCLS